jgi:hypothetical protein
VGIGLLVLAIPLVGEAAPEGRPCKPEPTDEVINYGDLITCTISSSSDGDTFRFAAQVNDKVTILAVRTSFGNFVPCIELSGPDGSRIDTQCGGSPRIDFTVTRAGTHLILIRDDNSTDMGSYNVTLERIFPLTRFGTAIRYGQTLDGLAIDPSGDLDFIVFNGVKDDRISLQSARTSFGNFVPCLELFGPDGVRVGTVQCGGAPRIDATLTQNGTHTLLTRDDNYTEGGTYSITLQCIVGSCTDAVPASLDAEVMPSILSVPVPVGTPVLASATITNTGVAGADVGTPDDAETADTTAVDALSCGIAPPPGLATQFSYQAINLLTSQLIGPPNTPANILPGQSQSFQISLTPTAAFCPTNVAFAFSCSNGRADVLTGVNTLLLTGGNPGSCGLRASATVNKPTLTVGQTLVAGVSATNPGLPGIAADIYVGILRPDRTTIEFLTSAGIVVGNVNNVASFRPLLVNVPLTAPFSTSQPNVLTRRRADGDARGDYVFFVAAVRTGALAGGTIPADQILAVAMDKTTFP